MKYAYYNFFSKQEAPLALGRADRTRVSEDLQMIFVLYTHFYSP